MHFLYYDPAIILLRADPFSRKLRNRHLVYSLQLDGARKREKEERASEGEGGERGRRPPRGLTLNREKNSRERRIYFANVFVDISVLANHFSEGKKKMLTAAFFTPRSRAIRL